MTIDQALAIAPVPRQIICREEPFRLFFPLGAFLGLLGVSLWPLYYAGVFVELPSHLSRAAHDRRIHDFFHRWLSGTAGPRITSARHFTRREWSSCSRSSSFPLVFTSAGPTTRAISFRRCLLGVFAFALGKSFRDKALIRRRQICARRIGTAQWNHRSAAPRPFRQQALFPALSPRREFLIRASFSFLSSASVRICSPVSSTFRVLVPICRESRLLPPGWCVAGRVRPFHRPNDRRHIRHRSFGPVCIRRMAADCGAILVYLVVRLPRRGSSFLGNSLRAGWLRSSIGMAVEALWPQYRIAAFHIVFISGFSFIVLTVAIRVIFGHSGNAHLFAKRCHSSSGGGRCSSSPRFRAMRPI